MTATTSTNRSVTLAGQNKIFSAIGVEIEQTSLGYAAVMGGVRFEEKTLTRLCQVLVKTLAGRVH